MKKIILLGIIAIVIGLAGFFSIHQAFGNPSVASKVDNCQWDRSATSLGSSTIRYMTKGTATSTLTCDSYSLSSTAPSGDLMDSATLAVQFAATSSVSTLNIKLEYANNSSNGQNCVAYPGACDWFEKNLTTFATSSPVVTSVSLAENINWTFASSTLGTGTTAGDTGYKLFTIPTPSRYVRVVFSIPAGSTAGGVWAELLPKKQR